MPLVPYNEVTAPKEREIQSSSTWRHGLGGHPQEWLFVSGLQQAHRYWREVISTPPCKPRPLLSSPSIAGMKDWTSVLFLIVLSSFGLSIVSTKSNPPWDYANIPIIYVNWANCILACTRVLFLWELYSKLINLYGWFSNMSRAWARAWFFVCLANPPNEMKVSE